MNDASAPLADRIRALALHVLPHHAISRGVHRLARLQTPLKDPVARWFIRHYGLDMDEAVHADPAAYPSFNALFTRALRPGARPLDPRPDALLSPADARVSQLGRIRAGRLLQAKGHDYTATALLGGEDRAAPFQDGDFITLYLSPRDYHRVHMPASGSLRETAHIPGRLFSVAPFTTRAIPGLFTRNERLVCLFDTPHGPLALVLVGAINVGSIETVWGGETGSRARGAPRVKDHHADPVALERGEEMGRFNLGSTVILLLPRGRVRWDPALAPDQTVRVGQGLGTLQGNVPQA
ncbi:phosphatidylserine decarboxylase [Ectothiorhodospira mobilis]|uniref:Phosphatidylserine decarboxylase proenzyme n=1 Tax=Ectothiorhodospira mobilis TaxID=195064 RepID=A0A1I4Q740_ECTMO|nr:archaetidylserine decarboxylase [Ectothiorhodospira mobilis]SFM35918.1 phosphatidylserine decarboxylase [Ectothiorhodospira mobilis]